MFVNNCERHLHPVLEMKKTKRPTEAIDPGFMMKHVEEDPLVCSSAETCPCSAFDAAIRVQRSHPDFTALAFPSP